jgi:ubiquinone/menaquinone biosynthesis C-methylase UbiE
MWRRLVFDVGAEFYGWMTWQETWRAHCRSLVDDFPVGESLRVLDVGVGPGVSALSILDRRPGAEVVGLDFSPRMLSVARRYVARSGKAVRLVEADAAQMPFEDGSFDVVTGHSFLYLVPGRAQVVAEIARVLRPGGVCVFLEPSALGRARDLARLQGEAKFKLSMGLWRVASRGAGRFTPGSLEALLGGALGEVRVRETLGGLGLVGVARKIE